MGNGEGDGEIRVLAVGDSEHDTAGGEGGAARRSGGCRGTLAAGECRGALAAEGSDDLAFIALQVDQSFANLAKPGLSVRSYNRAGPAGCMISQRICEDQVRRYHKARNDCRNGRSGRTRLAPSIHLLRRVVRRLRTTQRPA